MSDYCRVVMVGHLSRDFERSTRNDGMIIGRSELCAARTMLVAGQPRTETVRVPVEVIGAARVSSITQQFGSSSRLLIEGHLEPRDHGLVVVIDVVFNADPPLPSEEAHQQPAQIAWWE